tara:strand:+ start:28243 stop:28833 length:591 start_codon:yes stop_codon:yes gene_type:complete
MKKKYTIYLLMLLVASNIYAQEKPFRIGLKLGFPNVIGGNIEYVTPLLGKKLAASIEYSSINADKFIEPDKAKLTYLQIGLNYYFFKEGKGLYGNLSYGILDAELTLSEIESDEDFNQIGTANASLSNKSMNIKIGAKLGNGFYFRPEIGYSFTSLNDYVDVVARFPDGSSEQQREEIPSELTQGLLFNIGFGVAF